MAFLHLIRHGRTDWNRQGRWQGHADHGLDDEGLEQAEAVARALQDVRFEALYSSDLRRALQTAAPLSRSSGLPVLARADLREVDVGSWAGLTRAQVTQTDPAGAERHLRGGAGWLDGETYEELSARAMAAAVAIADDHADDAHVAVFSHAGVLRAVAAYAVGVSVRASRLNMHPAAHGALTVVSVPRSRSDAPWRLYSYNVPLASR